MLSRRNFAAAVISAFGALGILGRIRFAPSRGGPRGRRRLLTINLTELKRTFTVDDDPDGNLFAEMDGKPMEQGFHVPGVCCFQLEQGDFVARLDGVYHQPADRFDLQSLVYYTKRWRNMV